MTPALYEFHPLAAYFDPASDGNDGYVPKMYTVNGRPAPVFQIDHILPRYWGGPDHPRNYVVLHASINGSFAEKLPEYKMAFIEAHSPSALRRVHQFVTEMRNSPLSVAADRNHISTQMQRWSNQYA